MERELKIRTADGHTIYGTLRKATGRSRGLIIFVHGLGGNKNEHIFFNGARFFAKQGFDTFRFDLYSGETDGRTLRQCTLTTHAKDLERVVGHLTKTYKNIVVIGHSFGGLTILKGRLPNIRAVILWDPAANKNEKELAPYRKYVRFHKGLGAHIINWGTEILEGQKMEQEYDEIQPVHLLSKIHVPILTVLAGSGVLMGPWKRYATQTHADLSLTIIPKAGHTFDEDGTEEKLFAATLAFLKNL